MEWGWCLRVDGYIKLYRKLLNNKVFDNEKLLKVWIWCLLKASHSDHDQLVGLKTVHLEPGQFIFGRFKAAEELKINPNTLKDYMKFLENEKFITIKGTNKYSIVTVDNGDLHQSGEDEDTTKNTNKTPTKHHKQEW